MRLFEYGQAMTLILALVLLLASTDVLSRRLRRSLQPNAGPAENPRLLQGNSASRHGSFRVALRRARYVIVAAVLTGSFYFAGFTREHFGDAHVLGNMLRFCSGMFPPDFVKDCVFGLWQLVIQTLAISLLLTVIAIPTTALLPIHSTP